MLKYARRIVILVMGTTVVLIGVIMLVTPGPAFIVIPAGLAILATEYAWARRWLRSIRESAEKGVDLLQLRPFLSKLCSRFPRICSLFSRKSNPNRQNDTPDKQT